MGYTPPTLYVNKITGGWSLSPPDVTTTDDLTILPNSVDSYAKIIIYGNAGTDIVVKTGSYITFKEEANTLIALNHTGDDLIFTGGAGLANHNISFVPNGSGVLKFGTYTAGAATDSTGYITILDAAGNTRKLMVQA